VGAFPTTSTVHSDVPCFLWCAGSSSQKFGYCQCRVCSPIWLLLIRSFYCHREARMPTRIPSASRTRTLSSLAFKCLISLLCSWTHVLYTGFNHSCGHRALQSGRRGGEGHRSRAWVGTSLQKVKRVKLDQRKKAAVSPHPPRRRNTMSLVHGHEPKFHILRCMCMYAQRQWYWSGDRL
jgi:hypothetical protein